MLRVVIWHLCFGDMSHHKNEMVKSGWKLCLLHFVAFFHIASLLSTGVDSGKVGVDNEKALELTNSTVFHRGRQ